MGQYGLIWYHVRAHLNQLHMAWLWDHLLISRGDQGSKAWQVQLIWRGLLMDRESLLNSWVSQALSRHPYKRAWLDMIIWRSNHKMTSWNMASIFNYLALVIEFSIWVSVSLGFQYRNTGGNLWQTLIFNNDSLGHLVFWHAHWLVISLQNILIRWASLQIYRETTTLLYEI